MEELDGPKQTLNTSEKYLVESLSKRVLLSKILINVFKIKCSSYKVDVMEGGNDGALWSNFRQDSPEFPLDVLKAVVIAMLKEAVTAVGQGVRDPAGGSIEFLLVPLLGLLHTLLMVGVYQGTDLEAVFSLILPVGYMRGTCRTEKMDELEESDGEGQEIEGRDWENDVSQQSLLQMKLPEAVKLQVGNKSFKEVIHPKNKILSLSDKHKKALMLTKATFI